MDQRGSAEKAPVPVPSLTPLFPSSLPPAPPFLGIHLVGGLAPHRVSCLSEPALAPAVPFVPTPLSHLPLLPKHL